MNLNDRMLYIDAPEAIPQKEGQFKYAGMNLTQYSIIIDWELLAFPLPHQIATTTKVCAFQTT